jgi:hypothetical protein
LKASGARRCIAAECPWQMEGKSQRLPQEPRLAFVEDKARQGKGLEMGHLRVFHIPRAAFATADCVFQYLFQVEQIDTGDDWGPRHEQPTPEGSQQEDGTGAADRAPRW